MVGIIAMAAGMGTIAYFSDAETSTGNTFTAGTIDLTVANSGGSWADGVSGTWTAGNMAPADTVTATLYARNNGTLPIEGLLCDLDVIGDTGSLDEYFYVKSWRAGYGPDRSSITWDAGPYTPDELIKSYAGHLQGLCSDSDDIMPLLTISQLDPGTGNDVFAIEYTFEFKETQTNQNNAQGDSLTIRYTLTALSSNCTVSGHP